MRFDILSLFPGYFKGPFDESILKRAQERGLLTINLVDIRDYATNKWRKVDDRPFGGGPGMVMMAEPVVRAIRAVKGPKSYVIGLSPAGRKLDAKKAQELASYEHLVLVCGHYEGIDQRAIDLEVDEEISIGDVVLTNGCLPAIMVVDSVARFVPGVLGHKDAAFDDSFQEGLLEGEHYTRPVSFEGLEVPPLLRGGNHQAIKEWRLARAEKKTAEMRPDLLGQDRKKRRSCKDKDCRETKENF